MKPGNTLGTEELARQHWLKMGLHLRAAEDNNLTPVRAGEFKSRAMKEYLSCCQVKGVEPNPDVNEDNLVELLRLDERIRGTHGMPDWIAKRDKLQRKDGNR